MCAANGWTVCAEHVYIDAGESGKSAARPAYQRMTEAIEAGAVNRVVVTKLDRLSRNTRDFLEFLDYCDSRGCAIVSIAESFDTGTPIGRAGVTVLMAFAELERRQITDRVMTGKREEARQGGYNGARCPLGYTYENQTWQIAEPAATTVQTIFDRFTAGDAMKTIAADPERCRRQHRTRRQVACIHCPLHPDQWILCRNQSVRWNRAGTIGRMAGNRRAGGVRGSTGEIERALTQRLAI